MRCLLRHFGWRQTSFAAVAWVKTPAANWFADWCNQSVFLKDIERVIPDGHDLRIFWLAALLDCEQLAVGRCEAISNALHGHRYSWVELQEVSRRLASVCARTDYRAKWCMNDFSTARVWPDIDHQTNHNSQPYSWTKQKIYIWAHGYAWMHDPDGHCIRLGGNWRKRAKHPNS